ncbi:hypothetical protein SSPO_082080 [Streptomyces antimycoticus]|uniref:Uncharacterized protein n=1 Tax=Streptomyces antimycoticus TaxID=68175 RepID=A0A499UXT5_9ACTN|nr:hypothetical protein SSPO_082080 [Streptomyces antimycoticus]
MAIEAAGIGDQVPTGDGVRGGRILGGHPARVHLVEGHPVRRRKAVLEERPVGEPDALQGVGPLPGGRVEDAATADRPLLVEGGDIDRDHD